MKLSFTKLSGAGNDFVLVDASRVPGRLSWTRLARRLCERRSLVGADGLLMVRRKSAGRPHALFYYNADGTLAFCGNGTRCAAWWMLRQGWSGKRLALQTAQGTVQAHVTGPEQVRIRMPDVAPPRLGIRIRAGSKTWTAHWLDTGVPHAVVEAPDLDRLEVVSIGRALRRHPAFGPAGANVDFVTFGRRRGVPVRVRTYERGVEDETLACGTGAVAAALCACILRGATPPAIVVPRSGEKLSVFFRADSGAFRDIWLEGPARITFQGTVAL